MFERKCVTTDSFYPDCEDSEGAVSIKKRRLDSSEVQRILNAKSSHDWVVKEVCMDLCVYICTCISFDVTWYHMYSCALVCMYVSYL